MKTGMVIRFLIFFSTVSFLVCGLTYRILKRRLNLTPTGNNILFAVCAIAAVLIVVGPMIYRGTLVKPETDWSEALQWTQYYLMGLMGVTLILFLFAEFFQLIWGKLPFNEEKREFLTEGFAKGLLGVSVLSSWVGFAQAKMGPKVKAVTISLSNLPQAFDGYRIAQISDVHIGPLLGRNFLQSVVDQVNALKADAVVITGDLVDGTVDQLKDEMGPLATIEPKNNAYFCTGNHEYYSGAQDWIQYLESIGIHVFKNDHKILSRGNEHIMMAGVFDWQANRMEPAHTHDPYLAIQLSEEEKKLNLGSKILLAHNPYSIEDATAAGFDLQLSGHTHAGQFYPFNFIAGLVHKYYDGLYRVNDKTQIYVNRGTGFWGPPNRLGVQSEITLITLKKA